MAHVHVHASLTLAHAREIAHHHGFYFKLKSNLYNYNSLVLSCLPLLSGQFSNSQFFAHTNAIFVTCIRRPLLLSRRSWPPCSSSPTCICLFFTCTVLSCLPLLSDQFFKVPIFRPYKRCICIACSSSATCICLFFTCTVLPVSGRPERNNYENERKNDEMAEYDISS